MDTPWIVPWLRWRIVQFRERERAARLVLKREIVAAADAALLLRDALREAGL